MIGSPHLPYLFFKTVNTDWLKKLIQEKLPANSLLSRPCSDRTKSRVFCQYGTLHFFYYRVV